MGNTEDGSESSTGVGESTETAEESRITPDAFVKIVRELMFMNKLQGVIILDKTGKGDYIFGCPDLSVKNVIAMLECVKLSIYPPKNHTHFQEK